MGCHVAGHGDDMVYTGDRFLDKTKPITCVCVCVCTWYHGRVSTARWGLLRRVRFTYPLRLLAYNPVQLADRGLSDLVS